MTKLRMACKTKALAAAIGDLEAFDAVAPSVSALLMVDAYRETVDWEDGDDESVAQTEIEKTIAGEYGEFLGFASFSIAKEGRPAAQIAVSNLEDAPTILFVYTGKAHQRQGLAEALIRASAMALHERGFESLQLFVTDNNPARALYERLGFVVC